MAELSHVNKQGELNMVDISHKNISERSAIARATVVFPKEVYAQLKREGFVSKKGSIKEIARIAGIMAAKKTSDLIPLCHPIAITSCRIDFKEYDQECSLVIKAQAKVADRTGVEMEALVAASHSALTIYDMCKALSHDITIAEISLVNKTGGKSDVGLSKK